MWQEYAPIYCEPLYQPSTEDEPNKVIRQKNTLYQTQRGRLSHQTTKYQELTIPQSCQVHCLEDFWYHKTWGDQLTMKISQSLLFFIK